MSHENYSKCNMTLIQQPKQGKTANFKNKNPLLSHYKYIL